MPAGLGPARSIDVGSWQNPGLLVMQHTRFSVYVGIDQTGAVSAGGRPRPLHAAALSERGGRFALSAGPLRALDEASLREWLGARLGREARWSETAILVDSVIGLPRGALAPETERPWSLFALAARERGFGRAAAARFFARLLPRGAELPRRVCEVRARANSVFAERPYQRNVQCGTFRVWKELAAKTPWLFVWPFDDARRRGKPWLFEGYPSLAWRETFGFEARAPSRPIELVRRARALGVDARAGRATIDAIARSPDLGDAAALALAGAVLDAQARLFAPSRHFSAEPARVVEGWIAGLDVPP